MKVEIKKLPKSEIELKIEVPAKEFDSFIEKAILKIGRDLEVKGFRKGMAPKEIIEKEVGPDKILIEAADLAVKENYKKAIRQLAEKNKIEVISQPEIEIKKLAKGNEFIFSAKTAVLPEIKLPDYKKIASNIIRKEIKVEDKEIEDALKWLQRSRAKFTLKNQPAEIGDFVEIEYLGGKDAFILGEGHFIPGFEKEIIGMKANEEKDNIILKKDGKDLRVKVKVNSVQNVEFPEVNDEFAKNLGQFENLAALKSNIKEGLNLEKAKSESQRIRNEILEKISQATECEIPEVLMIEQQNQMMENFKKWVSEGLKISFKDYLQKINKTEKEILDSLFDQAKKRAKNLLILDEIGKREKIEVSEGEVKEEANKILRQFSKLDPEKLKEYTKEVIRNEKIFQFLENLVPML